MEGEGGAVHGSRGAELDALLIKCLDWAAASGGEDGM